MILCHRFVKFRFAYTIGNCMARNHTVPKLFLLGMKKKKEKKIDTGNLIHIMNNEGKFCSHK